MARPWSQASADAVLVWNRACDADFQPQRAGDRALKSALRFDGLTSNGGLGHTLDVLSPDEVREAIQAFRHLGMPETAEIAQRALALPEEAMREAMTDQYYRATEGQLDVAFLSHFAANPGEYETVR